MSNDSVVQASIPDLVLAARMAVSAADENTDGVEAVLAEVLERARRGDNQAVHGFLMALTQLLATNLRALDERSHGAASQGLREFIASALLTIEREGQTNA